MHLLDQLPGCGAQAQRDPLTSVPTYASATTGRVCAPEHHTHDKEAGDGSRGSQLAYDELAVKLLRGPSFFKGSGLHPRLHAHPTPVTHDGTPYPTILDKHPPTAMRAATSFSLAASPPLLAWRSGLRPFVLQHRKRYGYICTYTCQCP